MASKIRNIVVVGLGYIGLPTASILATKGYQVLGIDISENVVNTINAGKIHIVEPDLDILVKSAVQSGNLKASLEPESADCFIISVPTPFKKNEENKRIPDLSFVMQATQTICSDLKKGDLVILESTSPVGTTEKVADVIFSERPELIDQVFVAHCPERVLPGKILQELVDNDRIIGGINEASAKRALDLYRSFCNAQIFLTTARTAELAKLVENSYRDVNIAFSNELSMICEKLEINVWELIELANRHPRVNILRPGPGVGGHCLAVDPWFIVDSSPDETRLIRTARETNDSKPQWVVEKIKAKAERFKAPIIGCLGLSYKPDIDDLRESPSLEIANTLKNLGYTVWVNEPNIGAPYVNELKQVSFWEIIKRADIVVVLVAHKEYFQILSTQLTDKIVFDICGIWQGLR
jgi:UDP-N-acetyl-D-mannosaminuronic acid dehydrogenase